MEGEKAKKTAWKAQTVLSLTSKVGLYIPKHYILMILGLKWFYTIRHAMLEGSR